MKNFYNNDFLDQYSNGNHSTGVLPGAGIGAVTGGGLAGLFAGLSGVPLAPSLGIGALGAIPGGIIGGGIGGAIGTGINRRRRLNAYQSLSGAEQQQAMLDFAQAMDQSSGTDEFTTWAQSDPQGFMQFMLENE